MGEIALTTAGSRLIAAVRRQCAPEQIPKVLIGGLNVVWPVIRARGVVFGKNVAAYRAQSDEMVELLCGVEIADRFEDGGEVVCVETPGGTAVFATHVGPYRRLPETYGAIARWMRERGYRAAGGSMEVYGHWEADESRLRTEVYVFVAGH